MNFPFLFSAIHNLWQLLSSWLVAFSLVLKQLLSSEDEQFKWIYIIISSFPSPQDDCILVEMHNCMYLFEHDFVFVFQLSYVHLTIYWYDRSEHISLRSIRPYHIALNAFVCNEHNKNRKPNREWIRKPKCIWFSSVLFSWDIFIYYNNNII